MLNGKPQGQKTQWSLVQAGNSVPNRVWIKSTSCILGAALSLHFFFLFFRRGGSAFSKPVSLIVSDSVLCYA